MMEQVLLRFDFKEDDQSADVLQFEDPEKIFTTNKIDEVKPILEALEAERGKGKYLAGYISYEASEAFVADFQTNKKAKMPLIWFASFKEPSIVKVPDRKLNYMVAPWQPTISYDHYQSGIETIKAAIKEKKTNQVNYTTRLTSHFTGDALSFYNQLAYNQNASYSAYLDIGRFQILSASPELFFKINKNEIATRPMKGTMKRGKTLAEDLAHKQYLTRSEKERAENLMIVDVLKDDLEKISVPGTIRTPELLSVETYPTLHQMTSTVSAKLKDNTKIIDWFDALFPCGSITGTPKLTTMNLIDQLEGSAREVYCGAIGYITPNEKAVFNVPIRTVVIDRDDESATYGVGGGITQASGAESEYEETKIKAHVLTETRQSFSLLESLLLINGSYPYLSNHLTRLKDSAQYFNYPFNDRLIKQKLREYADRFSDARYKVRLLLDEEGEVKINVDKISDLVSPVTTYIAKEPIDSSNRFLYHKTTKREIYQALSIDKPDNFATLLWNQDDQLTEFTIGNLVLKIDGQYLTPPVESGLLPGTFRAHLLAERKIKESPLSKRDLAKAEEIWLINAVRGCVRVKAVKNSDD